MCSRIVVPVSSESISTWSQTWLTIQSPCPPGASRDGWRRPASGSVMIPSSWIWQTISFASYQIFRLPGDLACLTVLAATSLTASVRSMARASVSPAWIAYRCTTARIAARSVVYVYDMGSSDGGSGPSPSGRGTG